MPSDKPAASTGSGEAKVGDRSLCATCGVLIIFGGTDPLYRHKHWVHVERENESDEREYVNCAVPDNPHYLIAVPTPPASPTVTLEMWDAAYRAFRGWFDTPLARRRDNSEEANDARRRLREIDTLLRAAERQK